MTVHTKGLGALVMMCALTSGCAGNKDSGDDSGPTVPTTGTTVGTPTGTTTPCAGGFITTVSWNDDGVDPSDTDGDYRNDTGCDGDTVDISICDPLGETSWLFGMAEDGAMGWTGEDCFNGYANYDICHPIGAVGSIAEVCTPEEVVDGQTTLLDASKDPFTTYYLEDSLGACFVFGTDPAYYASLGCTEMM